MLFTIGESKQHETRELARTSVLGCSQQDSKRLSSLIHTPSGERSSWSVAVNSSRQYAIITAHSDWKSSPRTAGASSSNLVAFYKLGLRKYDLEALNPSLFHHLRPTLAVLAVLNDTPRPRGKGSEAAWLRIQSP